jgi:hypothetical protein
LIKRDEFAFARKFVKYGLAVPAATEGDVYIGAIWIGYQGVHARVE